MHASACGDAWKGKADGCNRPVGSDSERHVVPPSMANVCDSIREAQCAADTHARVGQTGQTRLRGEKQRRLTRAIQNHGDATHRIKPKPSFLERRRLR
jgi:hypothetical protein